MACVTSALIGEETAEGSPQCVQYCLSRKLVATQLHVVQRAIERLVAEPMKLRGWREEVAAFARANWSREATVAEYAEPDEGWRSLLPERASRWQISSPCRVE